MTVRQVKAAVEAANRFVLLGEAILAGDREAARGKGPNDWYPSPISGTAQSGELKRASLDLTRRLAEMRKS